MIIRILAEAVQLLGVLVPAVGCVSLLKRAQNRTSMYLLLANLGCLIINGSYMLLLQTKTYDGALTALKMEYFGNVVFYLTFGLFLWSYLKLKKHKWTKLLLTFWSIQDIVFLVSVWSENGLSMVFKSLEFQWSETLGLVLIQAEPGVLYLLRYSTMCIILVCGMVYTTVRMFLVQIASERSNLAKLAGAQFVICTSLILMLLFDFHFDIVPIFASLSILSIIVSVRRDGFFGITHLGHEWVFEQMADAFVIVDSMYGYLDSNSYARKIFPELNYKRQNEIVEGDMFRLFTNEEKVQQVQERYYNKKIMELWEKDRLSGYSLLLVDITEQYELMARVREEKERADAANQAKSAFVSNVSHEIRTPMNAIVGMAQIMLRRDLPRQEKEYLMNIQNSGNALLAIVNDLLDISKIESGKMELVDEEYDFMPMLSDLGMMILNRIGSKPVELLFDIDPELPARLYGDVLRIRQVIINLMNNATKFTDEGYVCLTVKVAKIEQDDMELFVSVKDTGQGIREEDIDRLFASFQQVDAKKNHHKEGTGLGLSISKQLVEMMNGSVGVKSEYGKGSEFYFTVHQKVVDASRAARLPEGLRAAVAGNMKSSLANEILRGLSKEYQLTYVSDEAQPEENNLPLFYFTDCYEELAAEEKRKLEESGVILCIMQNPMEEQEIPEGMFFMNKPLYSSNFCNLLLTYIEKQAQQPKQEYQSMPAAAADASILIVDDNEINRMVAEEMLRPLGVQIETASDGKQALELVQSKEYDLVFMDHLMPVMDGIEAIKAIRGLEGERYKKLPVIALTANTAKEQQEEYMQAGMSDYLSKPIDMTELYKKLCRWIPDKVK